MPFLIKILNAGITSQGPTVTNLYTVPASPTALGAIISNVRFVNTHATVSVTTNVYYKKGSTSYLITDKDKVITANDHLVIKPEITMGVGDILEVITTWGTGGTGLDFAVFGMIKV